MAFARSIVAAAVDVGNVATTARNGISNCNVPIWKVGAALYVFTRVWTVPDDVNSQKIRIYKSADGGVTWIGQDTADEPANSSAANAFVVGSMLYALVGPRNDEDDVALRLYSFDCATDQWALIDGAGPAAHWPCFVSRLSGGDFVVAYGHNLADDIWLAYYSGGVWTDIQDLTLVSASALDPKEVYGCLDEDENTHVIWNDTATRGLWHTSVTPAFTLNPVDASLGNVVTLGGCAAVGSTVLIPVGELDQLVMYSLTPLASPSLNAAVIDAVNKPDFPKVAYDPTTGKVIVAYGDWNTEEVFRYTFTTDLTGLSGWASPAVFYDVNTDPNPPDMDTPPYAYPPGIWAADGKVYWVSNYPNTVAYESGFPGSDISFYIGSLTDSPLRNTFE